LKIWYDACTGKHIRYGAAIGRRVRQLGHEFVFTARDHPDTLSLARILGEHPHVVGKYDPASPSSRLEASAERVLHFSRMFRDDPPDIAIAHQSVELCRTAFGLGIPIILTADTPHAVAVNRLTIPFAAVVVASEAIPMRFFRNQCAAKVVRFKGVDEVAWIKRFRPTQVLSLKKPLIVVRQMESKAAYAVGQTDMTEEIAKKLDPLGNVLFIGRYNAVGKEYAVKEKLVDSANLVSQANLVVSVGGTISRESALQGIPTIVVSEMGKTYVNRYLARKGFPMFITNETRAFSYAKKLIGKRFDVRDKLEKLEDPVDTIEKLVNEMK
jgi:predicted glycosyltransferase